jgi:nicotinamidase-related amidase
MRGLSRSNRGNGLKTEELKISREDNIIKLEARSRLELPQGSGRYQVVTEIAEWEPAKTAIIICDMWDKHWCSSATARVAQMALAINGFIKAARKKGILIVHAPSDCMRYYMKYPARTRAKSAPRATNLPRGMKKENRWIDKKEKAAGLPIDDSDGGCDTQDSTWRFSRRVWTKQIETIEIFDQDMISDKGNEIWNVFEERGIENVLLVGVHTNMCVLRRTFGLRNWAKYGKNIMLVRDLTDSMYNPEKPPYVDHFTGTDLVVEHIEKYICPSTISTGITGGRPFRFDADTRQSGGYCKGKGR